jgi:hypothetical protein
MLPGVPRRTLRHLFNVNWGGVYLAKESDGAFDYKAENVREYADTPR